MGDSGDVVDRVRRAIHSGHLIANGDGVVVGVSGGPDSLCLLHVLCKLGAELDLCLHVAHLDHGLRGAEADADAEYVKLLAQSWGLAVTIEREDVAAMAREQRLAVEEAARRVRYAFLARTAAKVGARVIAVGHHADDQTETVLMHWLRGAGLAGMRGMLPDTALDDYRLLATSGPSNHLRGLRLIRPLLGITRHEIEAYVEAAGLEPRFDRSNLDTTYFRNWLRHEVLPLLARHNPNIGEVIRRSACVFADEYDLLRSLLDKTWPSVVVKEAGDRIVFDLAAWRALPVALQRSTIRKAVHRLRSTLRDLGFVHVENALAVAREGTTGSQATLPRDLVLTVTYQHLVVAESGQLLALPAGPLLPAAAEPVPVKVPGLTNLPGSDWSLDTETVARTSLGSDWDANPDPWRAYLDAAAAASGAWLRTRAPGDRFEPQGMDGHSVKLSDFLTNQKVPRAVRDRLPLLVTQRSVLWICGQRLDHRARVQPSTAEVIIARFVRRCAE